MLIGQLMRPFGYLVIRHPFKWVVDWLYPATLTLICFWLMTLAGPLAKLIEPGGFVASTLSFVQSLPGFYIAALAAIATFGRSDIDDVLPEPTPKMVVMLRGQQNTIDLTRRRFLAMLFAFLTAESIVVVLSCIGLISFGAAINAYSPMSFNIFIGALLLLVFQMVLATFWGLYYLGYKLQE
ncbi:hypothetical protein [Pseudomonas mosselii]|uniref:hypothetical protein n=1 Tax=Pseudomonas mosselii TaxID=78327 RepID=UPI000BB52B1D|nr:hypothetical protein [Pseudomonas mosselii]ATB63301.1 hypothetical protein CLJ08_01115 [Pseudomonas mosselii]